MHTESAPAGLVAGSRGLFLFSLFWDGIMTLITVIAVTGVTSGRGNHSSPMVLLFLVPFWAIGTAMFLAAVNMGTRRVFLAAAPDMLAFRRKGMFGVKEARFTRAEVAAVRVGPSGGKVNDRDIIELQIHLANGRHKVGLLAERKQDELDRVAAEIRRKAGRAH